VFLNLENNSKKYPLDNALRNIKHTAEGAVITTSSGFESAMGFFGELFVIREWKQHICFRVKETFRISPILYPIHLFGDIALGPRPIPSRNRIVLSLHKYAHLIVDEKLSPLFKTAEEIRDLAPACGLSCIQLILRNPKKSSLVRATPVFTFIRGSNEESFIVPKGSSAYIQYDNSTYEQNEFQSHRYTSLLVTPINGKDDTNVHQDAPEKVSDGLNDDPRSLRDEDEAVLIAKDEKQIEKELLAKAEVRLGLLNRLSNIYQTVDGMSKKITDEIKVQMAKVYKDLDPQIEKKLDEALVSMGAAKKHLKVVKSIALDLANKKNHKNVSIRKTSFQTMPKVKAMKFRMELQQLKSPMLAQNNVWGKPEYRTKEIATLFTVIFNNFAGMLANNDDLECYKVTFVSHGQLYWRDLLNNSICRFFSLDFYCKLMNCCIAPVTGHNYNLFTESEDLEVRATQRRNEFHIKFWEAICSIANSKKRSDNKLFIAPSYEAFENAIVTNTLQSFLVPVDIEDVHGQRANDEEADNSSNQGTSCIDELDEEANRSTTKHGIEIDDDNNEEAGNLDAVDLSTEGIDDFAINYITGQSPKDLLADHICKHLDSGFAEIISNRNNLSRYTLCNAVGCIEIIMDSSGVCSKCKRSMLCDSCTTRESTICQTCNYMAEYDKGNKSVWIEGFPSLSIIEEDSCWSMSMSKIKKDPRFPKQKTASWSELSEISNEDADDYTNVNGLFDGTVSLFNIFGDADLTIHGGTIFRIMHEKCMISSDTHDAIVAIMNDSYSQYYVDQLLRADSSSSSNPPVKVHKYLNVC